MGRRQLVRVATVSRQSSRYRAEQLTGMFRRFASVGMIPVRRPLPPFPPMVGTPSPPPAALWCGVARDLSLVGVPPCGVAWF